MWGEALKVQAKLAILCACLVPVPLLFFNPDLAVGAFEWTELFGGSILAMALAAALGAVAGRLLADRPGVGARVSASLWLVGSLSLTGWIVAGRVGGSLALLPLAVVGIVVASSTRLRARGFSLTPVLSATGVSAALLLALTLWQGRLQLPPRQLIVVGLDGATWEIIDRMRSAGGLPNFDRLISRGARADLETLKPILSPPIWTSIATGRTPESHGVKDFWASSREVRAKRFWEIADEHGMLTGVLGYLVTWPPRKHSGFLVPGWLAQGTETVPPELSFLKRIEIGEKTGQSRSLLETVQLSLAGVRHGMTLSTLNAAARTILARRMDALDERDRAVATRVLKLELSTDVFCHLLRTRRPALGVFYNSSIDALQHLFFKYYEPQGFPEVTPEEAARFGRVIPDIYQQADRALARIIAAVRADAHVVVLSDHGQESAHGEGQAWYDIRSTRLLAELGIDSQIRATNVGTSVFLRSISGAEPFDKALANIRSVVTLPDGEPLFALRRRGTIEADLEVRAGFDASTSQTVRVGDRELSASDLVGQAGKISGIHTDTAMLLMAGPDIMEDRTLPRGSVLDAAPTILHLLGLPVARDLEGRVLAEALRPELASRRPIDFVDTYGAPVEDPESERDPTLDAETLERLKALGYVQ